MFCEAFHASWTGAAIGPEAGGERKEEEDSGLCIVSLFLTAQLDFSRRVSPSETLQTLWTLLIQIS